MPGKLTSFPSVGRNEDDFVKCIVNAAAPCAMIVSAVLARRLPHKSFRLKNDQIEISCYCRRTTPADLRQVSSASPGQLSAFAPLSLTRKLPRSPTSAADDPPLDTSGMASATNIADRRHTPKERPRSVCCARSLSPALSSVSLQNGALDVRYPAGPGG